MNHVQFLRGLSDEFAATSPNRSTDLDAAANELERLQEDNEILHRIIDDAGAAIARRIR